MCSRDVVETGETGTGTLRKKVCICEHVDPHNLKTLYYQTEETREEILLPSHDSTLRICILVAGTN